MKSREKILTAILASLIGLFAILTSGCSTYTKYQDEIEDMTSRVEVGVGIAVKDGWVYGPFKGRLRPGEIDPSTATK